MKIRFSGYLEIDTDHIPDDFDEKVRESFRRFTDGTAKDYTFVDKLAYIDVMRRNLHQANDAEVCVRKMINGLMDYHIREIGDIPEKSDFLSVDFMTSCFDAGRTNLYAHYTGDHRIDYVIMKLLVRAIKVVIDY